MKNKNNYKKISGFTIIELLVYVAGLLALGAVMIILIVQFYNLYREIIVVPRADRTGLILVDRIIKEIRSADKVDLLQSQFGTTNGVLGLDYVLNGVQKEKIFYLEDGIIKYKEDNGEPVILSSKDLRVSNFNFTFIPTPISQAVRFNLELEFQNNNATETKSYTGFGILRESYE